MKMKRILAVLLASMLTATALVGCGGSSSSSSSGSNDSSSTSDANTSTDSSLDNGVVDVSDFGDEDNITLKVWAPDAAVEITQKQCDDFVALYPDKTINISVVAQTEAQAGTQAQTDPSTAADVFGFACDQLDNLVTAKVISEAVYAPEVEAANSAESVEAGKVDGTLYYYPETTNGYFLVYDKSVVSDEQAGKFEDVLEACKSAGKKFIMDAGNGFYSCIFTFTGGCKIDGYKEDGETQNIVIEDEDKAVATLQAFAQLFKDYKGTFQALSVDKISSGFANGTCGAGIDGSWNTATNQEKLGDNFGAAKLPTINVNGEDVQMVSMYGYKALAVNAHSQYPRSAQILAYYLSGEKCQRERAEELAWGPTNNVVSEEDVVTSDAALTASAEQSKYSVAQVHVSSTFWDPMGTLGNQLIADEFDPADAAATKTLLEKTNNNILDE
jgi:arabinogalactan oligomer/maltooligosaccharide transport system substrate-binding protein